MSSTDNLPRPADSPCLKCASAGCTSITVGKGGDRKTFPGCAIWQQWFSDRWQGYQATAYKMKCLLLGAAGGYELQGHHEAAETVLHVIDALDELTTGGKGRSQADEDQEAMAAAETVRLYCEKRRKTGCCGESCIFDKGNKGALCPLYGSPMGWDRFGGKENG